MSRSPGSSETFGMRWNWTRVPRLGERAAVRPGHAGELLDPRDLLARRLVILENTALDEQPLVCGHALVVPRDAGERAFLRPIGLDVHEVGAVAQLSEHLLGRRHEARAGVVGLFANRAIELRGVTDGLVDREPEIRSARE